MENNEQLTNALLIPTIVPLKEASKKTGLSYFALRNYCIEGKSFCFRTGNKWLINLNKLCDFLNGENK